MSRSIWKALFSLAFIMALAAVATGQSTDRDNPAKLTSPDISGFVDERNAGKSYWYSFVAGPGEVQINLAAEPIGGIGMLGVEFVVFDDDARRIIGARVAGYRIGEESRTVEKFLISQKARLIVRLILGGGLETRKAILVNSDCELAEPLT